MNFILFLYICSKTIAFLHFYFLTKYLYFYIKYFFGDTVPEQFSAFEVETVVPLLYIDWYVNYNFFSNFNCTCAANALAAVGLCTCNNRLGSTQSRALPQQRPQNNLDNISTLLLTFFEF